MARLKSWGEANKITLQGLAVRYALKLKSGEGGSWIYAVTRYATKNYVFVGLDRASAIACRDAKVEQYTRRHRDGDAVVYACQADISVSHEGTDYRVSINVNETDEVDVVGIAVPPEETFAPICGAWEYDEGPSAIRLISATVREGATYLSYECDRTVVTDPSRLLFWSHATDYGSEFTPLLPASVSDRTAVLPYDLSGRAIKAGYGETFSNILILEG